MKTVKEIHNLFNGKLVGSKKMKQSVCVTLLKMPDQVINFITENCWFFASMEDAWAFTFTGNDLKNQHLIFLSDELLSETQERIEYTIAHEIGHVILGHRNSVLVKQTRMEINTQERQADEFAKKYLWK